MYKLGSKYLNLWDEPFMQSKKLSGGAKFLYIYLLTNALSNIAGVYRITNRRICFDLGKTFDINSLFAELKAIKKVARCGKWVIIKDAPRYIKNMTKSIQKEMNNIIEDLPIKIKQKLKRINYAYSFFATEKEVKKISKEEERNNTNKKIKIAGGSYDTKSRKEDSININRTENEAKCTQDMQNTKRIECTSCGIGEDNKGHEFNFRSETSTPTATEAEQANQKIRKETEAPYGDDFREIKRSVRTSENRRLTKLDTPSGVRTADGVSSANGDNRNDSTTLPNNGAVNGGDLYCVKKEKEDYRINRTTEGSAEVRTAENISKPEVVCNGTTNTIYNPNIFNGNDGQEGHRNNAESNKYIKERFNDSNATDYNQISTSQPKITIGKKITTSIFNTDVEPPQKATEDPQQATEENGKNQGEFAFGSNYKEVEEQPTKQPTTQSKVNEEKLKKYPTLPSVALIKFRENLAKDILKEFQKNGFYKGIDYLYFLKYDFNKAVASLEAKAVTVETQKDGYRLLEVVKNFIKVGKLQKQGATWFDMDFQLYKLCASRFYSWFELEYFYIENFNTVTEPEPEVVDY